MRGIRQPSAWGQFWVDLADHYSIHSSGVFTPLWHEPKPLHRGSYYGTWFRMVPYGNERRPVYFAVDGETMWEFMRNGLKQAGCYNLHMKMLLLEVIIEHISDWALPKLLRDDQ